MVGYNQHPNWKVHDAFLLKWKWVDAVTAFFAISISPWFSRGWTALELAKSLKVKIIFRDNVIKDLDEDILSEVKSSTQEHDKIVFERIQNLRERAITSIDQLLGVIGSRNTSWPRDVAIISAQLVGIFVEPRLPQQKIYQEILKKIGEIKTEHLFHNSLTMTGGFQWCPMNLLEMPSAIATPAYSKLNVTKGGDVEGKWLWSRDIKALENIVMLGNMHQAQRFKVDRVLRDLGKINGEPRYRILVDPIYKDKDVFKALLVLDVKLHMKNVEFVASLKFYNPLKLRAGWWNEGDVTIVGKNVAQNLQNATTPAEAESLDKDTELLVAAQNGDIKGLQKRLDSASPYAKDKFGMTPLHLAARDGRTEFVTELMGLHDAPTLRHEDGYSWTPLNHAVWHRHEGIIEAILDHHKFIGESLNDRDRLGQTVLHLAAERADRKIIEKFGIKRDQSVRIDIRCNSGQNIFHRAALGGRPEVIKELWEWAVEFYQNDRSRASKMMLEVPDYSGQTPLHLAAQQGYWDVACELADLAPPLLEMKNQNHLTPLEVAVKNNEQKIVEGLHRRIIGRPSDISHPVVKPALLRAAQLGYGPLVDILWRDDYIGYKDKYGFTPFLRAVSNGHEEVVSALIKKMKLATVPRDMEQSPLILAAKNGHAEVVKRLLKKKVANIEDADMTGWTALSWAAESGHLAVTRKLCNKGCEINHQTNEGFTPLELAYTSEAEGRLDVMSYLIMKGADRRSVDISELLLSAAEKGNSSLIAELTKNILNEDESLECRNREGRTPLALAACNDHVSVVKILLRKKANTEAEDNEKKTPLQLAVNAARGNDINSVVEIFLGIQGQEHLIERLSVPEASKVLRTALQRKYAPIAKLALERSRADVHYPEGISTPFEYAIEWGETTVLDILIRKASMVPEPNINRVMNLILNIEGRGDLLLKLIKAKVLPIKKDQKKRVLEYAVKNGPLKLAEEILQKELIVEFTDPNNLTRLFGAIASKTRPRNKRYTVMPRKPEPTNFATIKVRSRGYTSPETPQTPDEEFSIEGTREEIIEKLLEYGADMEARDENQ
ncbi:hypothetical protein TWF679_009549 [Orbilia oligospora]|uniref:Uncharacterized protein n=1 Tax=Orbilia oligospora TaxID=2813651 RepID=A0A8H8V2F0_ORBOL|nr:hypothetical protein TWF679_009549 [Orbilia oligospora]